MRQVFTARCVACHAQRPTNVAFTAPPKGLSLESSERIRAPPRDPHFGGYRQGSTILHTGIGRGMGDFRAVRISL